MSAYDNIKAAALLAAIAGIGYVGWRAYRASSSTINGLANAADSIKQGIEQGAANVSSWWNNNVADPFNGITVAKSTKDPLYSDYGYTGADPATGEPILNGAWYSDPVARRYDYAQRAAGATPAATSIDGAAFGVYPRALPNSGRNVSTQAMVRAVDNALGY